MLSERTIASLQGIAQQALQEGARDAPFDDARAAVRAVFENVFAVAAEAQNARRPTHRIPPELLAASFDFLGFADRVGASHVCRVWRSVALGCPSLWADIRVSIAADGSNAARVNTAVQTLLARTGALPIHLAQTRRRLSPDAFRTPVGILDLTPLLPRSAQLHSLTLDFMSDHFVHGRQEILANLAPQLRHLALRFTQATYMMTISQQASLMSRSLPLLTSLEICGAFEIHDSPWPIMPALKRLTLRNNETINVPNLATAVLRACPALESLTVVTLINFLVLDNAQSPPSLPSIMSIVLRGNLTGIDFCKKLISALGCDRAAHIALHHTEGSHIPSPSVWTADEFIPIELSFFRPDGFNYRGQRHHTPVARFEDAAGRSRTFILFEQPRSFVMDLPPVMNTITRLTLDESDFGPTGFPPRSTLSPALEYLKLRLSDKTRDYLRLFHRVDDGGICRLQERNWRWRCTALRRFELAYAPPARQPIVTCADLRQLLERLSAPPTVALGLQNLAIREPPQDPGHLALAARVQSLEVKAEYEPLVIEREWPSWRIDEDQTLE
ncbi:hypothetical protein AURDEDRAFT_113531 [Auricularia subglabra TFB-10046 SS5]|nr:hypothetical protein AURDEDRAFT_113531 [Auricularia subglabra TFB-10046 SS5]